MWNFDTTSNKTDRMFDTLVQDLIMVDRHITLTLMHMVAVLFIWAVLKRNYSVYRLLAL
jgi:hypothetical protein